MLFGEIQSTTRVRILVAGTAGHEHGDGSRIGFFECGLSIAGVITADLHLLGAQSGVVAGIAKHDGKWFV